MSSSAQDWTLRRIIARLLCLAVALLALLPGARPAVAQTVAPSRPILFVHGWCSSAWDWAPLYATLFETLPANLYPDKTVFWIQYNSLQDTINFWTENVPALGSAGGLTGVAESTIAKGYPNARFFALEFIDPTTGSLNDADVTRISILNKAYDISQVIKHITAITQIPSVNIVAHSMGGLDARAYVENMASPGACYDYANNVPAYYGACAPGTGNAPYESDVAHIITVDTPHAGAPLAANWLAPLAADIGVLDACQGYSSTNKIELTPLSSGGWGLIEALNFNGLAIAETFPLPNPVPIQAIQDYFTGTQPAWTQVPSPSDDVVTEGSQSITANLPAINSSASLADFPTGYNLPIAWLSDSSDVSQTLACWEPSWAPVFPMLHLMTCLGALPDTSAQIAAQLTNDTVPWISSWSVTPATLSLGGSVTIEYTAADYSTFQLSRAELWRAPDAGGKPGTWSEISSQTKTGNGPIQVIFPDTPPTAGSYWYGTHLFDTGGNEALEPSPAEVAVSAPPAGGTTPTVLVTPLSSSITTAQALTVVVGVSGPGGDPTPTGSVTLISGSYISALTTLSGGIATIVVPAGSLATGTDTLTAGYTPDAAGASTYTTASGSNTVTVNPAATAPVLSAFNATPSSVDGGATITYSVTLTGPAPTGGALISFGSSATSVIPNAQLQMLAGSTSGQTTVVAQNPPSTAQVTITASYNGGSSQRTVTVTPSSAATYLVTVQVFGAGDVTSQDGRLICLYSNCSAVYATGSNITLSEVPGPNYAFSGWGEACSGQGICSFTVANNMLVTATFSPIPGTVDSDLTTIVVGNGTITSTDGLVNCSTNCQTFYPNTASVILNAVPNPGYEFTAWTGACTGQGQCSLVLAHNAAVQATFSATAGTTTMAVSPGTIQTIAGNGTAGSTGDGGPTRLASLYNPLGVAVDRQGNLYIAEFNGNRIRVSNTQANPITVGNLTVPPGSIATLAGNGTAGFSGDGGSSTSAQIYGPTAVRLDTSGNLYFADADNNRVRVINLQATPITVAGVTIQPGAIMTVAGNGASGYTGDGVPATSAGLTNPQDVLVDASGNIYIAEWNRVRLVNPQTGIISTFVGGGLQNCAGEVGGVEVGCPANQGADPSPIALAMDSLGNLFLSEAAFQQIRLVYKSGTFPGLPASPMAGYVYVVAGQGSGCSGQSDDFGDGCPVFESGGIVGVGLSVDPAGSLYFANLFDSRIHRVDRASGMLTALAGNGTSGYLQDGVSATSTEVSFNGYWYGSVLGMDLAGNLYFSDTNTNRVREITSLAAPVPLSSPSVGSQGAGVSILVENIGMSTMNQPVIAISGTNAAEFSESDTCTSGLQPGASCLITTFFTPAAPGTRYAELSITSSNSQNSPQTIELTGNEVGAAGALSLDTSSLSFGNQALSTTSAAQAIVITNSGTADLPAPTFSLGGSKANEFSVTNSCQAGIKMGGTCSVAVSFAPVTQSSASATLSVSDSAASNSPQQVSVTGTGVQAVPTVSWSPAVSSVTYGTALGAGVLNATANVNGSSIPGSFAYTATSSGGGPQTVTQASVLGAGTYTLTATFSPTDTTDYAAGTASISFQIDPASLTLTATNASVPYGGPLPSFTYVLNGFVNDDTAATATSGAPSLTTTATPGSPVGSYAITPSVGTLVAANYSIAFVPGTLTITQTTQTITFGALANRAFGTAPFVVSATASSGLPVSFVSTTPADCTVTGATVTLVAVGTCTIQAMQAGNANYSAAIPVNQSFQVTSCAISGQVTLSGSGLKGVTMTLSGSQSGSVTTNASGNYSFNVSAGGNYTVTPSGIGFTFSPPSYFFTNLAASQAANFVASPVNYFITGQVLTAAGAALSGVTITLSGSGSGSAITNSSGNYNLLVPAFGNYTVTPSLSGYTFNPASLSFSNLSGNQTANFTANKVGTTYTISGHATLYGSALSGVTVTLSGSQSDTVTTSGSGDYSFIVAAGGSYTVMASRTGYYFYPSPPSFTFGNLSGNQTANFQAAIPSDFSHDGHPDVIWEEPKIGWAQVWYLGGPQGVSITGAANLTQANPWNIVGIGDFNGDGKPDVVWQDPVSGAVQVWFLGGAAGTTVMSAANITTKNPWKVVSVADFNQDGHPDLLWQDPVSGWVQIWYLGGSQGTTLLGAANLTLKNPWHVVGTGDFNNDGFPDVLWQDPVSGTVQIWYMGGTTPGAQGNALQSAVNLTRAMTTKVVAIADFNQDGHPDVVFQDPVTGAATVYYYTGAQGTTSNGTAVLSTGNPWYIAGPH